MKAFQGEGQGRVQKLLNLLSLFEICSNIPTIKKLISLFVLLSLCVKYIQSLYPIWLNRH